MQQGVVKRLEEILKANSKRGWKPDRLMSGPEEITRERPPDRGDGVVGLGGILFPQVFPESVSGIISRCKLIEPPEPRAQGMAWFRPHMLDDQLKL